MTEDRRGDGAQRREQEVADRALRELFAGRPCPDLPPFFASRCAAHVELAPAFRPPSSTAKIILRAYWVVAAVVGVATLTRIDWPAAMSPVVAAGLVLSITGALLPVVLFARRLAAPSHVPPRRFRQI
jgi:hypothetical protein